MIGLMLAVAVQTMVAPPVAREQEVVVTARRLKDWRGKVSANAKGSRCKTTLSTGDKELDQIACDPLRYCTGQMTTAFPAAIQLKGTARTDAFEKINRRLEVCGEEQRNLRVADLVERRAMARINNASN